MCPAGMSPMHPICRSCLPVAVPSNQTCPVGMSPTPPGCLACFAVASFSIRTCPVGIPPTPHGSACLTVATPSTRTRPDNLHDNEVSVHILKSKYMNLFFGVLSSVPQVKSWNVRLCGSRHDTPKYEDDIHGCGRSFRFRFRTDCARSEWSIGLCVRNSSAARQKIDSSSSNDCSREAVLLLETTVSLFWDAPVQSTATNGKAAGYLCRR
jgi:hypothetical protein